MFSFKMNYIKIRTKDTWLFKEFFAYIFTLR